MRLLALISSFSLAASSVAGDIQLAFPLACTLGQTCYIQQTVDHDSTAGIQDFSCGSLTYDGHKGTDIALPSLHAQSIGVSVLAAADGRVMGVRNTMDDILQNTPGAPDVSDRECGNGIVIQHNDGWETQYCHMARGSITVQTGQFVTAGDELGLVGLSGATEFPHLHLSLRKDGAVIDPFAPSGNIICGETMEETLWNTQVPAPPGGIILSGFASEVPEFDAIKAGTAARDSMPRDAPALVLWGYAFGARAGDTITIQITGPSGEIISQSENLVSRIQAQFFRAAGRRTPPGGWPHGIYIGSISFRRDGSVLDEMITRITLQ